MASEVSNCPVCMEECVDQCIFCETCSSWTHIRCQNILKIDHKHWSDQSLTYICVTCRSASDGQFDYAKGSHDQFKSPSPKINKINPEVGKGGLSTSPGALHTDCQDEFSSQIESPSAKKNKLNPEVGKGGLSTSPGALHTDIQDEFPSPNKIWYQPDLTVITEKSMEDRTLDISNDSNEDEFVPGPLKSFLDLTETVNILKGPTTPLESVPLGRKDGMYFVLDNVSNLDKRNKGQRSDFWDDCGKWVKGASPCSHFIEREGKLITVIRRAGQFCMTKQQNKKREFIPLEIQPSDEEILSVHRFYATLKQQGENGEQFKRRITWVEKGTQLKPDIQTGIAIVEYVGQYPGRSIHGAVKHSETSQLFVRTKSTVIENLKHRLKHRSVKEVEREINNETSDDFEKQRNESQLRKLKQEVTRGAEKRMTNVADQIKRVEEMVKTHPFVQSVCHIKGMNHPVVTLYTDQQIVDVKRFCATEKGCVLGMGKTYILGEFHVTATVYKDMSVIKRSTNDHPICIGPTFIHQCSTTKAYSQFYHDIAVNLTETERTHLTIGPVTRGKISSTWTNNNCASANHVLKTAIQSKKKDLPNFINILHGIVIGEQEERCRALRGTGNFMLAARFNYQLVDVSRWATMTEDCRKKRLTRFLSNCGKDNDMKVTSTDGTRCTQRTPSAGRKPQQTKRKRAERSRTPS